MSAELNRRLFIAAGTTALAVSPFSAAIAQGRRLTSARAASGLREALRVAARRVISRVGRLDGYLEDEDIRIPLPSWLSTTRRVLARARASGMLDDLEIRLNRAAEQAAPRATAVFVDAIRAMTVEDAINIVRGPDNAATVYFQEHMTPRLREEFRPIIQEELQEAGAIRALNSVVDRYNDVPLVRDIGQDATGRFIDHGLSGALDGIFYPAFPR